MSVTWHEDGDGNFFVKMTGEELNQYLNEYNSYNRAIDDAIQVAKEVYKPQITKWGEFTCVSHPMVDLDEILYALSKLKQKHTE